MFPFKAFINTYFQYTLVVIKLIIFILHILVTFHVIQCNNQYTNRVMKLQYMFTIGNVRFITKQYFLHNKFEFNRS